MNKTLVFNFKGFYFAWFFEKNHGEVQTYYDSDYGNDLKRDHAFMYFKDIDMLEAITHLYKAENEKFHKIGSKIELSLIHE